MERSWITCKKAAYIKNERFLVGYRNQLLVNFMSFEQKTDQEKTVLMRFL